MSVQALGSFHSTIAIFTIGLQPGTLDRIALGAHLHAPHCSKVS